MSTTTKKTLVIIVVLFTLILFTGIAIYFYTTLHETSKNESFNMGSIQTANDLNEMVKAADVIAVGSYEGLYSTVNLARDEKDPSKVSEEEYLGGKVYRFEIDHLLKGSTEEREIHIAHRYSGRFKVEKTLGYDDKEVDQTDPSYIKPSFGKTYIVFINRPNQTDFYTQSLEPFMMTVSNEDVVEIRSNIEEELDFDDTISGQALSEVEKKIEDVK